MTYLIDTIHQTSHWNSILGLNIQYYRAHPPVVMLHVTHFAWHEIFTQYRNLFYFSWQLAGGNPFGHDQHYLRPVRSTCQKLIHFSQAPTEFSGTVLQRSCWIWIEAMLTPIHYNSVIIDCHNTNVSHACLCNETSVDCKMYLYVHQQV
jgi:hypothetical protein